MNHPRKLPQRAECPDTWGSNRDRPEAPENNHTQKRTGDKTSLKRRDHPCCSFREICSFSAEARRGAGHRTLLMWLSSRKMPFLPVRLWPPLLRCNARTRSLFLTRRIGAAVMHRRSAPKRKDELMRCTCCLLYSRCDQRQLDAMIACQCPLAHLVTLEVDWSLWRDPNFVGHPTWLGVTDWMGTNVTAPVYQEILEHFMLPSADQLFKDADFIFQQDLAPAHTAKSTKSWLNDHGVGVLDWPANSPDLNPIDNLWGIVKRKMRNKRPKNADELKATVKETWASIPPQQCHKLITSMPRRIEAVIKAKWAPTKYWVHIQ